MNTTREAKGIEKNMSKATGKPMNGSTFLGSLYTVEAVLILNNNLGKASPEKEMGTGQQQQQQQDSGRVYVKYYTPPHTESEEAFNTLKKQIAFEKNLMSKTKKQDNEIMLLDNHLVLYKKCADVTLFLVGPISGNEILLNEAFGAFKGSLELVLNSSGIDRKNILEHYDMVLLAIDETFDNGIVLETDAAAIASRVSKPITQEPVQLDLDKGLLGAWGFAKSKLQELQQGL
ncbi:hypothetical protein NCAS_0A03620 [Naumovozyma castellii]|uniref:Coatomer subunit zeta n=1 Tax=Naumovozyma castellii TaxID=27288 RepID=G0V630_NAUCA|nr:hypothetical protein NCAS_0A03620 [Naumovozyma castellii CBS 4309]CCC66920.1 hypothetical protein NCAS_0A03620 [Naumovozyma castellii CBS 4309]